MWVRRALSVSAVSFAFISLVASPKLWADEVDSQQGDDTAAPCEKVSPPADSKDAASKDASKRTAPGEVTALAAMIDNYIVSSWGATVVPAELADDAEYARRVHLDLTGSVPTVAALREFLADASPDKRQKLVDRLLDSPQYARHFSNVWMSLFLPEVESNEQVRFYAIEFKSWLQMRLREGMGYNAMARELLTTPLDGASMRGFRQRGDQQPPRPSAFYQAKELKAENLASATARVFLGIRVDCAQCHNHPFTAWKQEDFWAFAAYFDKLQQQAGGSNVNATLQAMLAGPAKSNAIEISIPDTKTTVAGRFLGTHDAAAPSGATAREMVADWITSDNNPYFARTAVNRAWAHLLGTGIVDPIDDFDPSNPASHPELLDELARQFVAHGYDQKFLFRAIMASRPYQLTSRLSHPSQRDRRTFARMTPKGLTAEQLLNSLKQITSGNRSSDDMYADFRGNNSDGGLRELFTIRNEAATDRQLTVLQALSLMNGSAVASATDPLNGRLIAAVAEFPGMKTEERVETLFLATLSRPPRADELARLTKYVAAGGPEGSERMALCDVLWVLVNSSEFLVNH